MNVRLRKPALAPPPVVVAEPWEADPGPRVVAYFRRVLADRMAGLPFINPALAVATTSFLRVDGDWLGAVLTPWCLQLVLLPGGGALWEDIPAGERRYVGLPAGALEFIADSGESDLPVFQYCPLIAPVTHFTGMTQACQAAGDALAAVVANPAEPAGAESEQPDAGPSDSRRQFLRKAFGAG